MGFFPIESCLKIQRKKWYGSYSEVQCMVGGSMVDFKGHYLPFHDVTAIEQQGILKREHVPCSNSHISKWNKFVFSLQKSTEWSKSVTAVHWLQKEINSWIC